MGETKRYLREVDCADCGELIPEERLKLVSGAKHCIKCQEILERRGLFTKHTMSVNYIMRCGEIDDCEETLVRGAK